MNSQTCHYQTLAVTILAIATAVIGFGLFGSDQLVGIEFQGPQEMVLAAALKLLLGLHALAQYGVLLAVIGGLIKQKTPVTGQQVTHGPLLQTALVMASVALIFIIGIFYMPQDLI